MDIPTILRVGLCQFLTSEEKTVNLQKCATFIDQAVIQEKAQLLVLPEIWNSPYATAAFPEYAETLPESSGETLLMDENVTPSAALLQRKAMEHKVWIVGGSIPERVYTSEDGKEHYYNTCLVFNPQGTIVAKHRKVHLFDVNVPGGIRFCESETISAGETVSSFDTPWCRIGVGICYDVRFPEYAMLLCNGDQGCRILVYPGAFNLTTGPAHWELLQRARAVDHQVYVLTASPARTPIDPNSPNPPKTRYPLYYAWGHSMAVSPWGDVVASADETEQIVTADLDLSKIEQVRNAIPVRTQKRTDMYNLVEQARVKEST
jgi:omega-amidase